jgi:hypothetical protein
LFKKLFKSKIKDKKNAKPVIDKISKIDETINTI